jgi:cytochrome c-type biogenesis protein CcmE
MVAVGLIVVGISAAVGLGLTAFQKNLLFYFTPTQLLAGEAPEGSDVRMGGLVVNGSVKRQKDSLDVQFALTDTNNNVDVVYTGILPDLFREGQGIIAQGHLRGDKVFVAKEVLAKHDEKYMPPEVASSLAKAGEKAGKP